MVLLWRSWTFYPSRWGRGVIFLLGTYVIIVPYCCKAYYLNRTLYCRAYVWFKCAISGRHCLVIELFFEVKVTHLRWFNYYFYNWAQSEVFIKIFLTIQKKKINWIVLKYLRGLSSHILHPCVGECRACWIGGVHWIPHISKAITLV